MLLMLFLWGTATMAQQKTYSGTVRDEAGKPMTGATVSVKGTKTTRLTNDAGQFSIPAAAGDVLEISFSGYENGSVKLGSETTVSLSLKPGSGEINEVVVTGTRGLPRSKLESTAPVDVLDLKNLVVEAPQTNITDILNNIAPSFNSLPRRWQMVRTISIRRRSGAWAQTRRWYSSTESVVIHQLW
jgi:iron complex outermembrane receptor protein